MPLRASSHPGSPNSPSCSALAWYSCWPGLSPWGESWKRTRVARTAALTRYRYATQPTHKQWVLTTRDSKTIVWTLKSANYGACVHIKLWPSPCCIYTSMAMVYSDRMHTYEDSIMYMSNVIKQSFINSCWWVWYLPYLLAILQVRKLSLKWQSRNATSIEVMFCCHQATNHYLNQC